MSKLSNYLGVEEKKAVEEFMATLDFEIVDFETEMIDGQKCLTSITFASRYWDKKVTVCRLGNIGRPWAARLSHRGKSVDFNNGSSYLGGHGQTDCVYVLRILRGYVMNLGDDPNFRTVVTIPPHDRDNLFVTVNLSEKIIKELVIKTDAHSHYGVNLVLPYVEDVVKDFHDVYPKFVLMKHRFYDSSLEEYLNEEFHTHVGEDTLQQLQFGDE